MGSHHRGVACAADHRLPRPYPGPPAAGGKLDAEAHLTRIHELLDLARELVTLVDDPVQRCEPVKELRNRWLSYNDLALKRNEESAQALPDGAQSDVDHALEAIARVLSRIHAASSNSQIILSPPGIPGGAVALSWPALRAVA